MEKANLILGWATLGGAGGRGKVSDNGTGGSGGSGIIGSDSVGEKDSTSLTAVKPNSSKGISFMPESSGVRDSGEGGMGSGIAGRLGFIWRAIIRAKSLVKS